ncbi:MAG: Ni/Fe-hydrogenase, b-type cytochrome subunit [Anaerolineales bacterium]|nr:MAG: Ni/Fe-hydrogenase, b-type cytochrome subunit [Anaerolineales bacterium]
MATRFNNAGRVYVWEIPVRLTHWVNVACIIVLSFTGYYIGNPYVQVSHREAYGPFFMGNMRFIHLLFAYVFIASLLIRVYWAIFAGNQWASWRALIPFATPEGRGKLSQAFRYYFFLRREPPTVLGHNALAGFTYAVIIFLYFTQTLTGFALHAQVNPGGFWWTLTGWVFRIVDNQSVRLAHHMIMWLLIAFAIHHVYSAFLVDVEEANGLVSSIFSGWKFIVPESKEELPPTASEQGGE